MRKIFNWKGIVIGSFIITTIICLFALGRKLHALDANAQFNQPKDMNAELPWERMVHPFVGSVLFK